MADESVRQGKAIIQDANEFYRWAITSSMKEVTFIFIEKEICSEKKQELDRLNIKSVKNTMKLHAVVGVSKSSLLTQVISCYCEDCLNKNYCTSWVNTPFEARSKDNVSTSMEVEAIVHAYKEDEHLGETSVSGEGNENVDTETAATETDPDTYVTPSKEANSTPYFGLGEFVACIYNEEWYIGEIVDIDEDEQDVEINFMEKSKELYRWPRREDKIWVSFSNVLCVINRPAPCGKSQRNYRIDESDIERIRNTFEKK